MSMETVFYYLAVLRERIFIVIVSFFVFASVGVLVVHWWTPVYQASATILVERPQIAETLAASTVQDDTFARLGLIRNQILLKPELLAMADRFKIERGGSDREDDRLVDRLRERLAIDYVFVDVPRSSDAALTLSVSFEDGDPLRAKEVVEYIVDRILDENRQNRLVRAEDTVAFFDKEVKQLDDALGAIEAKILKFKSENLANLPDSLDFRRTHQAALQDRLLQLGTEEQKLRMRRASLVDIAGSGTTAPGGRTLNPAQQSLADLQRTLDTQRAVFSEDSDTVVALKSRIDELRGQLHAAAANPADSGSLNASPELRLELSDIDTRLDAIPTERANATAELEKLDASIAATPKAETALNELTRDYESTRARYMTAIAHRGEALAGQQIELGAKSQRLLLLEPPTVPDRPVRPKRLPVVGASAAGGIGLGLGLLVLLELVNRTVRRPSQVTGRLGIEPLVAIPCVESAHERIWRHGRVALLWIGTALSAVGFVLLVHLYLMPLDAVAERILGLAGLSL
jgi:polysaccharide biosynthesis transport protein